MVSVCDMRGVRLLCVVCVWCELLGVFCVLRVCIVGSLLVVWHVQCVRSVLWVLSGVCVYG